MDGIPLYREIYEDIRRKIDSGEYSENAPLPAERVLCDMYHVSRSTIRASLEALYKAGYIGKVHGTGNFVKPKMFEQRLTKSHSFASSLKAQHILIKNQILDYDLIDAGADKYLSSIEQVRHGGRQTRWHKLVRLRSAEAFPLMIETTYLPQSRFLSLEPDVHGRWRGAVPAHTERARADAAADTGARALYALREVLPRTRSSHSNTPHCSKGRQVQVQGCVLRGRACEPLNGW